MIRKALPVVFASALVLTACNTDNGALPDNNETPMQNLERDMAPDDNRQMGPDLDGLGDDRDDSGIMHEDDNDGGILNNDREGIIDDNNRNTLDDNLDQNGGMMNGENGNRGARDDNTNQGKMNGNDTAPNGTIRDEDRKVK